LTIDTAEPLKPRSQYVDEAVQMAIAGNWDEAVELNQFILDNFGPDDTAQNRLGKALTELGRLADAKAAYEASLKINPQNTVAQKNSSKLDVLLQHKGSLRGGPSRVDLNLFVEEMGKTATASLKAVDGDVCSKVQAGDVAELRVNGDGIEVDTVRGIRLGTLEAKLARRLIKFIQGGNRYQAGVTSCEGSTVKMIVRETYQDPKFQGKPSFPIVRKREVEFRPYTKESLLSRDPEAFASDDDDDMNGGGGAAEATMDLEEGLHEVEEDDDSESVDFSDEAADDASDEEDEDEGK
jgi:tetratricopeptide (TPR) repeat protein